MRRAEFLMLLLCCPLGRRVQPLTQTQYRRFAQLIKQSVHLLGQEPMTQELLLQIGCTQAEAAQIFALLHSEGAAQQYLAARPDVTPLTRLSEHFPSALLRLQDCPAALFCLGDVRLFDTPKISLVGNRTLSAASADFAERIGRMAAEQGYTLVSGGARGADSIAQEACLLAGGSVISILPTKLPRTAQKNVLYCSDDGYATGFTAARALRRNHYIHALGERTYVAQCSQCRGGTWSGCQYNLQHGLSPLHLHNDGSPAALELLRLGALLEK